MGVTLSKEGMSPIIVILDYANDDTTLVAKELFWIQRFVSESHPLLNVAGINPGYFLIKSYDASQPLRYIQAFIHNKRRQRGLTQEELARQAGVGLRLVRDIEQGRKDNFETRAINKILAFFGAVLTVNEISGYD